MDRRAFIKTAAGGVALTGFKDRAAFNFVKRLAPGRSARTPVKHVVIVMMENRSTDHFLGWYGKENPAFDGSQSMTVPDLRPGRAGKTASTRDWGKYGLHNFHGRGYDDPSHSWTGGRAEFARGRLDGWLDPKTGNDEFCLAYYNAIDVPILAQLTRRYQTYDRWFCSLMGPTQPNRFYMHSGQSGGRTDNDLPQELAFDGGDSKLVAGWSWPTIWDLFDRFNVSAANYFSNLPELAYWGLRHANRMRHIAHYFEACATGTLPQVSIINPFYSLAYDYGNDDHPHADLRLGQALLSDITEAFVNSRHYKQGALMITYDEWGGFFDHVPPLRVADDRGTPNDPGGNGDFGQLGFRVPSTIVSPWTERAGAVDHTVYDHASMVRFITENWDLPYLTTRVRSTNSVGAAFGGFRSFRPEADFAPYDPPFKAGRMATINAMNDFIENVATDPTDFPEIGRIPGAPDEWPLPPLPVPDNPIPGGSKERGEAEGLLKLLEQGWFDKLKIRTDWKLADGFMRSRPALLADART